MKLKSHLALAAVAGILLTAYAPAVLAQSVGVNFVNGGSAINNGAADSMLPTDTAGVAAYAQTNWNNLGRYGGSGAVLTNSVGTATSLIVNWDATGTGSTATTNLATGDGKLMDGFLYTYASGAATSLASSVFGSTAVNKPLIFLGGLNSWYTSEGAEGYAIVLYITGYNYYGNAQRWIQAASGNPLSNTMVAGADLSPHLFSVDTANYNGTYVPVSASATNAASATYGANYVVFSGFTNDAVLLRSANNGNYAANCINGFQIVPVYPTIPTTATPTFTPAATVYAGVPVTITEAATGDPFHPALFYQWQTDYGSGGPVTNNIINATNATYSLTPTNSSTTYTINYQVIVTNIFGAATSSVVTLTVNPAVPPYVTQDTTPGAGNGASNVLVYAGGLVTFNAAFAGPLPITNQWQINTGAGFNNLLNATNNMLMLTNAQLVAGNYQLLASNPYGSSNSTPATLVVLADPPAPVSTQPYAYDVFTNNPVAYWRLGETNDTVSISMQAYDSSGNGHNGTYGNGTADNIVGPQSPAFPGFEANNTGAGFINNYLNSFISVPPLNLNTNTVTITAWIQPSSVVGPYWGLFINRNGGDGAGLGFGGTVSNGIAELGYAWNTNSASTYNFHSGLFPPANQWSFVALTVTPTNATLYLYYVDINSGVTNLFQAVNPIPHSPEAFSGGTTRIGSDNYDGRDFQGTMDEVAVFNHALSQDQLVNLFATALGSQIVPSISKQPTPATLNTFAGQTIQLTADGVGYPAATYQWQAGSGATFNNLVNGGRISGANSTVLTVNNTTPADALNYRLVLANSAGSVTSSLAVVSLTPVPTNGQWTVNFQVINQANSNPGLPYTGSGILGSGTYWNGLVGADFSGTQGSTSGLADDGVTQTGIAFATAPGQFFGGGYSGAAPSNPLAPLLAPYYKFGTNDTVFIFTNAPNGTYNLALYGIDGSYSDRGIIFTVNGASQTLINAQDRIFTPGDNTALYTNVVVTNGVLNVHMTSPAATPLHPVNAECEFNGAQLQLVQAMGNPPKIKSINLSGGNFVITGTSADAGQSYRILSTTNLAIPLANWVPVTTNIFPGGAFTNSLPVDPATPQSFYRVVEP